MAPDPDVFEPAHRPSATVLARKKAFHWLKGRRMARRTAEFERLVAGGAMKHVHGPAEAPAEADLVVICPILNGAYWLPSFLRHYGDLGHVHVVFIDNGSRDETLDLIRASDRATLLTTDLPFNRYQTLFRRWGVQRYARGRWALIADADELLDFPGSDRVALRDLLGYLDANGYNVVLAHMLEMFGERALSIDVPEESSDLKVDYPLYDLSMLARHPRGAWLVPRDTPTHLLPITGGIRERVFGERSLLTKHSLVKWDDDFRLLPYNSHLTYGSRIADVAAVLLHYKFVQPLFRQARAVVEGERLSGNANASHTYARVLADRREVRLQGPATHRYAGAARLVEQGYLFASPAYREFLEVTGSGVSG
jgi:hypothetical protein